MDTRISGGATISELSHLTSLHEYPHVFSSHINIWNVLIVGQVAILRRIRQNRAVPAVKRAPLAADSKLCKIFFRTSRREKTTEPTLVATRVLQIENSEKQQDNLVDRIKLRA